MESMEETMYTSSGNYEAFARPRKPEGVDDKKLWIVGGGLAGLGAAVFALRDAQLSGSNITIIEKSQLAGGALDGIKEPERGFVIRGGREMEANFECLWDLFRSIPSLEVDGSVLDEFYWLNKDDPNHSLQRVTKERGKDSGINGKFNLSKRAQKELLKVFLASRESMEGKRIDEVFSREFLDSPFWTYWRTMFAFEEWHSALEFKLYLHRFVQHIKGLPDFSTLKFTKYNQYESLVLPMTKYLLEAGVKFQYGTEVTDIDFAFAGPAKTATRIHWIQDGVEGGIDLAPDDVVLTTIGSLVDNSDNGDHHTPAKLIDGPAPAWDMWRRIARKDPSFGHPDVFTPDVEKTNWQSATVTTLDERIPAYIERICKRDPFSGRVVTGGIVTAEDSSWLMSWTVNRQPHFKNQKPDQIVVWVYSLFTDRPGDYVKKAMRDCTGEEITQEWLFHMGVPVDEIDEMAASGAKTVPVMMPYVTSFFMPRHAGDRPAVVPEGARNFGFLGQFAETGRDCIFTTEYSVRTGMEAVYTLFGVERGVPETFASTYDVRTLLRASAALKDGKKVRLPKLVSRRLDRTVLGKVAREAGVLE